LLGFLERLLYGFSHLGPGIVVIGRGSRMTQGAVKNPLNDVLPLSYHTSKTSEKPSTREKLNFKDLHALASIVDKAKLNAPLEAQTMLFPFAYHKPSKEKFPSNLPST
jgi:hypothetical protein